MIEHLCNVNIYDLSVGKDFLIYKTAQTIKDKIDKSDNTKAKNARVMEDSIQDKQLGK